MSDDAKKLRYQAQLAARKTENAAMELYVDAKEEVLRRHVAEIRALIDASYDYPKAARDRAMEFVNGALSTLIQNISISVEKIECDMQPKGD